MTFNLIYKSSVKVPGVKEDKGTKRVTALETSLSGDEDEFVNDPATSSKSPDVAKTDEVILKIPALTWYYWMEKMTATTFGETFADFWSQTLGLGYASTSATLISIFAVFLACQLYVKKYVPVIFWAVMSTSSIAGTLISDFIDRTLHWGYPLGMGVLLSILLVVLGVWKISGLHMNVAGAMDRKQEALYWTTILVSNTLGTALGDFLADTLDWGFLITAGTIGAILVVCAGLALFTKFNPVVLFWVAFILTRPFGASFGDLLTKGTEKGGLDLGTGNASAVIFALFLVFFAYELYVMRKNRIAKTEEHANDNKTNMIVEEINV
jgi:uncharacterized membrane-anchored protein